MKKLLAIVIVSAALLNMAAAENSTGSTSIAKWQDDKKACFLLMFDDSWPSHWQVAVPELVKRKMTATFYINPGKGEYKVKKDHWEGKDAVWKQGMSYGNHTMTHNGMQDYKDAEWEIGECNKIIIQTIPGNKRRLISWGRPGVKDWKISNEETKSLLENNLLIDRPTFKDHGVVYHLQKPEQMLALADKAIKEGGMEYLIAHGVERGPEMNWGYQDFWAWKLDCFRPVLDGLAERRDRGDLWITDHISYHKYDQERANSKIEIVASGKDKINLKLSTTLDPELYDQPLTLKTSVPKDWKKCSISQGKDRTSASVENGIVKYNAIPNGGEIVLSRQN